MTWLADRWSLPGWPRRLIHRIRVPLLWAVLVSAFYWEVLRAPADQIVGGNDLSYLFQIWLEYARGFVHRAALPTWTPYLFSGFPFLSDPETALFYPPTWLAFVLPVTRALGLILVLHIWWAGVGAFGWLRAEGYSRAGALAGAAVFAFGGYTFARVQAGHLGVLTTGAWLPWGLWALRCLTGHGRVSWRTVSLGALVVGAAFLAGHPPTFVLVALMWCVYALYRARGVGRSRGRLLWQAGVMGAMGLGLAAVQLLPFAQLLISSTRLSAADYEFASRFSWPVGYLLTLLVPNFFGEPVRTGYWGEGVYEEMIFYVGVLTLLLMVVAVRADKRSRFWGAICGCSLLMAFGGHGVVHRLLFRFVPVFSAVRAPARAGLLFTLGAAALTAAGLTALEHSGEPERHRLLASFGRGWVGAVLGGVAVVTAVCYMAFAWGRDSNDAAGRLWHLGGQVAGFGFFFALAIGYLHCWRRSPIQRWLPIAATGLLLLDLWTLGAGLVRSVPAPQSAYWRIVSQHTDASLGRVLPWGLSVFEQNGALSFGVRSVFAYTTLEDDRYDRLVTSIPDPRARVYDLLNVAYVVTSSPLELAKGDTLSLLAHDSGVNIYRRATSLPRAWIAPAVEVAAEESLVSHINDPAFEPRQVALLTPNSPQGALSCSGNPAGTVSIVEETESRLVAGVQGDGGMLVFSERFAPGWTVAVDGVRADLARVDAILRGVCVPAGAHTVTLTYRPTVLAWGAGFTGVSFLATLVLFFASRRRNGDGVFSQPS